MGATTAKEAWSILHEEFQGSTKVNSVKLQTLRRDFENIKMKDSESMKDYYSRIKEIVNKLRSYGDDIADKKIVEKILISMTENYDSIVTVIEESKDIETLSVTKLIGSLEAYEARRSRRNESSIESAFQSKLKLKTPKTSDGSMRKYESNKQRSQANQQERKNYPPCGICKKTNHLEKYCFFRGKQQCTHCKRYGHVEKDCRWKHKFQANYTEERAEAPTKDE